MVNTRESVEPSEWIVVSTKDHGLVKTNSQEFAYELSMCLYQNREKNKR